MKVKDLQKTVNIAWSPQQQHPIYLVAGTAAQQFDANTNTSTLEIYAPNFSEATHDMALKSSLPSQYRFQKLIWSPTGFDGAHRNGLIVGGCEGGHVMIYSAAKMLAQEEGLVARQDKHTGPVSGLDFNPFQTNLLATCASESEIFIWDLNNTTTHMNPGAKTQPLEDVKNVAWNRQVQHILASVFSSRCVIWDLRKSEQIIKLSDTQSRVRWHAIQWHPEVATQVWLASEDDQAPVVQLWDLRYATAPAKTMQIHQRGVLGMSWCTQDTDLMVSCGKDNRIYCWNPNTEIPEGEILSEVATTATWYSDVQWCPRNPALITSSCLDGNVSIYSLFGGTQEQEQTTNKIADSFPGMDQFAQAPISQSTQIVYHDLKRAPKWIKKPCGVSFGFGGKLVYFNNKTKSVNISQVITEPQLVERANALEQSLNNANYVEYCRQRADQMPDQDGRYLWYFIKANFELNPREEMLNLLGYNKEDVDSKFSKYVKEDTSTQNDVDHITNRISQLTDSDSSEVECDHSTECSTDVSQPVDNNAVFDNIAAAQKQAETVKEDIPAPQFRIPRGDHPDSLVTEALLTGNLEAAVELCMDSNRFAEALIIASTAGYDVLNKIQSRYLKQQQQNELSNVILALVSRDWDDFIKRCTIDSWKEALVAALRHGERKVVDICERLGDRLLTERSNSIESTRNAMLCYICAGSVDKLINAWYKLKQLEHQNSNYKLNTNELQELAEVAMLMSKSLTQQGIALEVCGRFAEFISEYGGLLASQGALTAALAYIFALGTSEQNAQVEDLRERLHNTVNPKKKQPAVQQHQNAYNQQGTANLYSRQQQQRGSFSQPSTAQPLGGTGGYSAGPGIAQPLQNQYQQNTWNTNPQAAAAPPAAVPPPTMFNPATATSAAASKPPVANETMAQPTRPLSNASSQGGGNATSGVGGGKLSRSKYVLDPSVAPSNALGGYGNAYNPAPTLGPAAMTTQTPYTPSSYNANFNPGQSMAPQSQPVYNTSPFSNNTNFMSPLETAPQHPVQPPPFQNMQRNPTPPPGWNDPPALKAARTIFYNKSNEMSAKHAGTRKLQSILNHKKMDQHQQEPINLSSMQQSSSVNELSAPINLSSFLQSNPPLVLFPQQPQKVEPMANSSIPYNLYDPNQNQNQHQNGYMDPNAAYQQPGMPPPPMSNTAYNPSQQTGLPPTSMGGGGYLSPAAPQNNNISTSQSLNYQGVGILNPQQQQQQTQFPQQQQPWNSTPIQNLGYTEQPAPIQQQKRQPEPPKEKPPLPEEYIYLQTVLEELKNQCLTASSDPRLKKKFGDVAKRLENLYDCLRDGRLSPATIASLNQIVQNIQVGDYGGALQNHTQIAFGSDFSQCAGFMPGLKVLVQSANDLQVYLR